MNVTTKLIHDTRYKKKDSDTYPVRLRVTNYKTQLYYPTGISMTVKEWEDYGEKLGARQRDKFKDIRLKLNEIEKRAKDIINGMSTFEAGQFKEKLIDRPKKKMKVDVLTIKAAIDDYRKYLLREKKQNSYIRYGALMGSLDKFLSPAKVVYDNSNKTFKYTAAFSIANIDIKFIRDYEEWLIGNKASKGTIHAYMANIRVLLNDAIHQGLYPAEKVPFGNKGRKGRHTFQIETVRRTGWNLSEDELKKLDKYNGENTEARDYWLFSYLTGGMNIADMIRLKWTDIENDEVIVFKRKKSEGRTSKVIETRIPVTDDISRIIETYGSRDNIYVFGKVTGNESDKEFVDKTQNFTKWINKRMHIVGMETIGKEITTMYARYTAADVLKKRGVPFSARQQALSHSQRGVTEEYTSPYNDAEMKMYLANLTAFREEKKPAPILRIA
ncbi:tyrosine-type recombinase/integrase [Pollutibacter soli]|uniref:tyrosine-type recombinase/integrase n=1 Tax=Pollutibacter soli TaxID=3034157 RepID=UPI0030135F4B